jgi:CBS domain-containing protein
MTSPAITVAASALITDAARLMHERNVRRLVVVDQRGRIAGIVSRSDLLQVFLRTDEDLREEVVERIIPAILPTEGDNVVVEVRSNVITLSGEVDRRSDSEILTRMSREVDGVVDVVNLLRFRWDDLRQRAGAI